METTTIVDQEFICPEHNEPVWECNCDGVYCPHDVFVSGAIAKTHYKLQKNKKWNVRGCVCGMNPPTDLQLQTWFEDAHPEVKKKPKADEDESRPGNWYLITLTQHELDKTVDKRILAAKKVLKSKQVSPEQWCYSLELTAKGTPHVHIALFTYKYPEYRTIKSFNDGYRVDITREKFNVKDYVVKHETKPSAAMLATWGLDTWFFCSENYSGPRPAPEILSPPLELISPVSV